MVTLEQYKEVIDQIVEVETKQLETVKEAAASLEKVFANRLKDHTLRSENDGVWEVQSALHRLETADRNLTSMIGVYEYLVEMFELFTEEQKQIAYNNMSNRLKMYLGE